MLEFLNEQIRVEFHNLSIDQQQEYLRLAEYLSARSMSCEIVFVDGLEVSIRINKQANVVSV